MRRAYIAAWALCVCAAVVTGVDFLTGEPRFVAPFLLNCVGAYWFYAKSRVVATGGGR